MENLWVAYPLPIQLIGSQQPEGVAAASAFVLRDDMGRELDIHVLRFDQHGVGVPAWNTELLFPADAFAGRGMIAGTPVCCLSPDMQMITHSGYTLLEKDRQDLRRLRTLWDRRALGPFQPTSRRMVTLSP